jgi:uncharacterized protein (TIGR00251 family)
MRPGSAAMRIVGEEVQFEVRLVPRASRAQIGTWDEAGRLRVRVAAPPVDGAANDELIALFSERTGVPKRNVRIVRGATSRGKTIGIQGTSIDHLTQSLGAPSSAIRP